MGTVFLGGRPIDRRQFDKSYKDPYGDLNPPHGWTSQVAAIIARGDKYGI